MGKLAYVLSHGDEAVTNAVVRTLEHDGWTVLQGERRHRLTAWTGLCTFPVC